MAQCSALLRATFGWMVGGSDEHIPSLLPRIIISQRVSMVRATAQGSNTTVNHHHHMLGPIFFSMQAAEGHSKGQSCDLCLPHILEQLFWGLKDLKTWIRDAFRKNRDYVEKINSRPVPK